MRTVVDLRGVTEVDAYPNHPMREAGATIHHVPLIDPAKREESGFEWETMTLVDLYRFILESAGSQFVEVMQIIAEPANHPLVFHCAAGKDRAGLIAATVLGLLQVDDEEIVDDYAADLGGARRAARPRPQAGRGHRPRPRRPLHDRRRGDDARGPRVAARRARRLRAVSPRSRLHRR